MLSTEQICELPQAFAPCEFRVKWADGGWEHRAGARAAPRGVLRRAGRVRRRRPRCDRRARAAAGGACRALGGMPDEVVGTVRIHAADAGHLVGLAPGRARAPSARIGTLGAHADPAGGQQRPCARLRASSWPMCRAQNVPLFQKLHWHGAEGRDAARPAAPPDAGRPGALPALPRPDDRLRDRPAERARDDAGMAALCAALRAGRGFAHKRDIADVAGALAARCPAAGRLAQACARRRRLRRHSRRRRPPAVRHRRLRRRLRAGHALVRRLVAA